MFEAATGTENAPTAGWILPFDRQVRTWRKASRRMKWHISREEFAAVQPPHPLAAEDLEDGFIGSVLSYGFGDDGQGHADAVLSGRLAWDFARSRFWQKTWQCRYIDFDQADHFRLRPDAPPRPRGFYYTKFKPGDAFLSYTVSRFLKTLSGDTGCGPEGIQMIAVTHPHLARWMNRRKIAFMTFADYDVAPYGFNDFFDCLQMFCSVDTLGLGIGNLDRNYPLFGIPTIRLR
ncbi:MAG: hypothetical protein LJE65_11445 [Desulfobacteraceae bacterium]|nr:hypothetical protein [Desulfobacteraceae bacterium]